MDNLVLFYFLIILISPTILKGPSVSHCALLSSCDQSPYPEMCDLYLRSSQLSTSDNTHFVLRDVAVQAALSQAQEAHKFVSSMGPGFMDERAKMAWEDCLELYEDTVYHLNQTMLSRKLIDFQDVQTYLSAAVTNQETCKNGFTDFNLSSHIEPLAFTMTNFTKLLSNALAINKASIPSSHTEYTRKKVNGRRLLAAGFPSWVSAVDRKLLQSSGPARRADLVVALDGSGNYRTISEAVAASKKRRNGNKRLVIYVKAGVYKENVVIKKEMKNLMLIGDGIDATVVTNNKNANDGSTTFRSATVGVSADGFIARGITFENTAGPDKHQAVALRSGSDYSVFYGCSFNGYQDTLYVYAKRQFYRDCLISGTVDFIFGDATAVLQGCTIHVRKPMPHQQNTVTAQSRSDPNENTGIVIHSSRITASPDLVPVQESFRTFLGRPWKEYSRVVVMRSYVGKLVNPEGWAPWNGDFALKTLYYGEYMNIGPGAGTSGRVKWPGYHVIGSQLEAEKFTVGNFLAGDQWIPTTGVPFTPGL